MSAAARALIYKRGCGYYYDIQIATGWHIVAALVGAYWENIPKGVGPFHDFGGAIEAAKNQLRDFEAYNYEIIIKS